MERPARQWAALRESAHRPWPLPEGEWLQAQTWEDLLFAHWRLPVESLRPYVPDELDVDTFDGAAWIAVTPFRVVGLRVHGLLPLPYASAFLEVNVRTYATCGGKAGIYFFSLDASRRLAVEAARVTYRLPYFHARMSCDTAGDEISYASERIDGRGRRANLRTRYRPVGDASPPKPGTREHFLTERYCLFTMHEGALHWAEIHHPPWQLAQAEAELEENTMPPPELEVEGKPLYHFSASQDVLIWPLARFAP